MHVVFELLPRGRGVAPAGVEKSITVICLDSFGLLNVVGTGILRQNS